jgi:DNA (cytosine-5)-methyltransferase 1
MNYNIIDLFAGCGGLLDGFLQAGNFNSLASIDWELATVKTLRNRLQKKWGYNDVEKKVIHFDLQRTQELLTGFDDVIYGKNKGIKSIVDSQNVDFIIGGPPCQAYSLAGRVQDKNRMQDDYRNYLFESYVKIVDYFSPKAFIFENVEGMLSAKPNGVLIIDEIRIAFDKIGYDISDNIRENAVFNLSYFNVPQSRKRVIIFGVKKSNYSKDLIKKFYSLLHEAKTVFPLNAEEGFKNLPRIMPLENNHEKISHKLENAISNTTLNHDPRYHSQRDIDIFRTLALDIQLNKNKYTSSKALIKLYQEITGKESKFHKYHVINPKKPSNTIPAHLYKDGLRHIHPDPEQARTITVREAARLQTFPDDFEFIGSKGDQYKMVGNAVPPNFSKLIANILKEIIQ